MTLWNLINWIDILLIVTMMAVLLGGALLFWSRYRRYPFTALRGYTSGLLILVLGFSSLLPFHLVPASPSYLAFTQIFQRVGVSLGLISLILFTFSTFLLLSFDMQRLHAVHLGVRLILFGMAIGAALSDGISHVLLSNGQKFIVYSPFFLICLTLSLLGFFSFNYLLYLQIQTARITNQTSNRSSPTVPKKGVMMGRLLYYLPFSFVLVTLMLSRSPGGYFLPTQLWLLGLILFATGFFIRFARDSSQLIHCDVQLQAFLVVTPSGVPLYTCQFVGLSSSVQPSINGFTLAGILSALQSFLRATLGREGYFKYALADQGIITIEQELGFHFCLVTDKMNLLVRETVLAIKARFLQRFRHELQTYVTQQLANLALFRSFDADLALFRHFFL